MLCLQIFSLLFAVVSASIENNSAYDDHLQFPPNFLLGAATAAYQIEGAWNVSGKGESVWDRFAHTPGNILNNDTGDVAADSYHKYKEDVALLKQLGFNTYRFSISWPRILPHGTLDEVNSDGIMYYRNLIKELLHNDIQPMVTLYHWDHPQAIEDKGGWLSNEMPNWFRDYANIVFQEYARDVKLFITMNEPMEFCRNGYSHGVHAPGIKMPGEGEYICIHNVLKSHAYAYNLYQQRYKVFGGQIGMVVNVKGYFPKTPQDLPAVNIAYQFNAGWTLNPLYAWDGDYPKIMKEIIAKKSLEQGYKKSRLPEFGDKWIEYIKRKIDFVALNHYTSRLVENGSMGSEPCQENDQNVTLSFDNSWNYSASTWLRVAPKGLREVIRRIANNYGNPPIYITENGFSDFGTLTDDDRINYFRAYLEQMLLAINRDGLNVKGYVLWSLMDNFEWNKGYGERFGIVSVDFKSPNRTRTLKKSAEWWQKILKNQRLDYGYEPY